MRHTIAIVLALFAFGCSSRSTLPGSTVPSGHGVLPKVIQTGQSPSNFVEFTLPSGDSGPIDIVRGPDGAIWFNDAFAPYVDRITMNGHITHFNVGGHGSEAMAVGPDGNLWFIQNSPFVVGRLTPSGILTEFPVPPPTFALETIIRGPDGRMWFTNVQTDNGHGPGNMEAITMDGQISVYGNFPRACYSPFGMTIGADGDIWVAGGHCVAQVAPTGQFTIHKLGPNNNVAFIVAGRDGNLWGLDNVQTTIDRISYQGHVTTFPINDPVYNFYGIIQVGNNLYFAKEAADQIGIFNEFTFKQSEVDIPTPQAYPAKLALGPDQNIWFTEFGSNKIGVLLRDIISVSPSSVTIAVGGTSLLTVSEVPPNQNWTATSSNPNVATVSALGSQFTVTGAGSGSCTVTVKDSHRNSFNVSITVQ